MPDSKTGKKVIYLSKPAVKIIQEMMKHSKGEYLLPGRVSGKPIVNLRKPWLRVCKRAGLERFQDKWTRLSGSKTRPNKDLEPGFESTKTGL